MASIIAQETTPTSNRVPLIIFSGVLPFPSAAVTLSRPPWETGNVSFNVILGNLPYSGHSSNKSQWIAEKAKGYYPPKKRILNGCGTILSNSSVLPKKSKWLFLGFSGITVAKYVKDERDYDYVDFRLDKPVINTFSEHGEREGAGLIDEALEKIKSILLEKSKASLKSAE